MLLLRLLLLLAACALAAAYDRPAASKDFKDLDTDESGHVSRDEIDGHLDRQFEVRLPSPLAKLESTAAHWLRFRELPADRACALADGGAGVDGVLRHGQGRAGARGRVLRAAQEQPALLGQRRHQQRRVRAPPARATVRAILTLRCARSYTDPDEMRINRDRSHPNRVDTFLKYYDDNTDGSIHKHEFDAKHNEL